MEITAMSKNSFFVTRVLEFIELPIEKRIEVCARRAGFPVEAKSYH
jgi:hypothetical protein